MAKELDNKRMLEYLLSIKSTNLPGIITAKRIKDALSDQGFKFDGEHIIPIKQETKPSIKEGDWVVFQGETYQVIRNGNSDNLILQGRKYQTYFLESECRFWTIEDAKDGDVLVCESGWTCIFKTLVNDETFSSYCFMDKTKWFCEIGSECHTLNEAYNGEIKPATKEQRDLLFAKIKEAGYEWDAENKQLLKLSNVERTGKNCEELTEFEIKLYDLVQQCQTEEKLHDNDELNRFIKQYSWVYLEEARKQIASEIDVNAMVASYKNLHPTLNDHEIWLYRKGIKNLLSEIKGE